MMKHLQSAKISSSQLVVTPPSPFFVFLYWDFRLSYCLFCSTKITESSNIVIKNPIKENNIILANCVKYLSIPTFFMDFFYVVIISDYYWPSPLQCEPSHPPSVLTTNNILDSPRLSATKWKIFIILTQPQWKHDIISTEIFIFSLVRIRGNFLTKYFPMEVKTHLLILS